MGLKAGQFISDLVTNWPLPTDRRREGDDHLRLLKQTIKNTFPNINAAVTATPTQLNALPPKSTANYITELKKHIVPRGTITMWSGLDTAVPVGWAICNGQTVTGFGVTPDLRDRFIRASGPAFNVNDAGGATTATSGSAGDHEHVIDPVALTSAQMPQHSHRVFGCSGTSGSSSVVAFGAGDVAFIGDQDNLPKALISTNNSGRALIEATGSGSTHTHGMQPTGAHTHVTLTTPLYYTLTFIIKTTAYVEPTA